MTKDQLLAALRENRIGWTTLLQTMAALESTADRLFDNAREHLSDADWRRIKKSEKLGALKYAIKLLEGRR